MVLPVAASSHRAAFCRSQAKNTQGLDASSPFCLSEGRAFRLFEARNVREGRTAGARRRGGNEGFPMKVRSAGCGVRKGEYGGFAGARSPWWWGGGQPRPAAYFGQCKSGRGLPHSTTLARRPGNGNTAGDGCATSQDVAKGRQLLECAGPPALWRGIG